MIDGDVDAVSDIIKFCKDFLILLHITKKTLNTLMNKRYFDMMKILIEHSVYYQHVISKEKQKRRMTLQGEQ